MSIIINADDFGVSEYGDNTIIMLHKLGVVSSTTIIANGDNFSRAVNISKENPRLGIGVHLCLDGPFNIGKDYYTIMDSNTNQFYNLYQIIKKLKRFSADESEIFREYCLQIEKVLDQKINISHLDSHHHLHMYLPSLRSMIKAANKFNIHYIRSQKVILRDNQSFYNYLYRCAHQLFIKSRIKTVDGLYEPSINKDANHEKEYNRLLKLLRIKNAIIEIMLHPIDKSTPETIFFTSQKILNLLLNQNIINYHDL
ncbi:MAG: ChbG/HpnK family deacetylase [Bacteroidia bacterium]|nr:ChbG/HpnK family deacetylase [Bacteroidia bacterium]